MSSAINQSSARPILTIGIPTYNRAAKLSRLLSSLAVERSAALTGDIEVLISDNASTDDTESLARAGSAANGYVYRRNETNLGFDGNIQAILKHARGEFVWIMGDDDLPSPGFLTELVPMLRDPQVELLIVTDRRVDWPPDDCLAKRMGITAPVHGLLVDFLCRFGLFGVVGGIGHSVFRLSRLGDLQNLRMGTAFCHVFFLADNFAGLRTTFIEKPAFIVPVSTQEELTEYVKRWDRDGLWIDGWYNCHKAVLDLFDRGRFIHPVPSAFFRMMYSQDWPLHYHVYAALAKKLFQRHEVIGPEEWNNLARFNALLGDAYYTELLNQLYSASQAVKSVSDQCLKLLESPKGIYQT